MILICILQMSWWLQNASLKAPCPGAVVHLLLAVAAVSEQLAQVIQPWNAPWNRSDMIRWFTNNNIQYGFPRYWEGILIYFDIGVKSGLRGSRMIWLGLRMIQLGTFVQHTSRNPWFNHGSTMFNPCFPVRFRSVRRMKALRKLQPQLQRWHFDYLWNAPWNRTIWWDDMGCKPPEKWW